jgi:transposase
VGRRGLAADQANAVEQGRWLVFADEAGISLTPPVRRTWAPRGQTPILRHRYRRREQVSMAGLLAYRPDGSRTRLLFAFERGAYDTDRLTRVLDRLEGFLGGQPVTLIWDNLAVHRSKAMRAYVATHDWLKLEFLPPYAPELNPVEGLWANLKGTELANLCAESTEQVIAIAQLGLIRIRRDDRLPLAFLIHAGLAL